MRGITHIVLHCTATSQNATLESIVKYWRNVKKWKNPGYHHIIKPNGEIVDLLPIEEISNGVQGHNAHSINISYIGGVDKKLKALDNRTDAQKAAQVLLLNKYSKMFPNAIICGHRDFPGVTKECPSFDVTTWLKSIGFYQTEI